jgi:hypothetical protein
MYKNIKLLGGETKKDKRENKTNDTLSTNTLPKRRLTKGLTSKISNSSMCSPVPMNITGLFVAATLQVTPEVRKAIIKLMITKKTHQL